MKRSSGFLFVVGSFLALGSLTNIVGCSDDTGGTGSSESSSSSSSSGASSSSGSGSSSSGAGGGGGAVDCNSYCTDAMANCTGANAQYADMAQCMTICATWPAGMPGAMSGNSLECRAYHVGVAAGMPAVHCPHAGPFGDGACGASCDNFCDLLKVACTGADFPYTDDAKCKSDCATFATMPPYSQTNTSGNSLGCREYHLTVATGADKSHCAHAGMTSTTCM